MTYHPPPPPPLSTPAVAPQRCLRIAIVGAGSAGLLLALLLQHQGHAVTVFEKAEQLRTDGCGILLVQAGCAAIAAAGLDGLLEEVLAAYAAERLPVVHRYQERSRAVSARTGRQRAPARQPAPQPSASMRR
jgi:2-polyprenyl-6-methoxyphenol hydroxylase-like FAD-dependent oxidoreductase